MTVEATSLSVHRCRFVDFTPSAVTALAFPPLPLPSARGKKSATARKALEFGVLAVGRANGNIELCEWTGTEQRLEAAQAWVVTKTISGPFASKIDSLVFTLRNSDSPSDKTPSLSELRLFSAGGGSELAEWDLERACIRRTIPSQGGSIWCITPNPASTIIAIGCEDGGVRLLSVEHDTLTHLRRLDRVKSRILSLAWGPPVPRQGKISTAAKGADEESDEDDEDEWKDEWVVAGCSDSSLRKWDLATGRTTDRMGTDKIRGERTLVWAVNTLGDGTIVSGDSLGMVKFWDSRTCTQLQSFQAHGADVLCLTVSPEGTAVYSSGVDQKVIQFTYVKTQQPSATQSSLLSRSASRWVQSIGRRLHSHDVRSLAIWPPYTSLPPSHRRQFPLDVAPILASGGLDMSVVVTPAALPASTVTKIINPLSTSQAATFEDSYHRRLAYNSGAFNASALHLARQARLLLCQRDAGLSIWRISTREKQVHEAQVTEEDIPPPSIGGWEPVLDMDLSVHTNTIVSAISDDGRWVAVSDWYESKLFQLQRLDSGEIKPKRIRDFTSILRAHLPDSAESTGASCLSFTPDATKLVVACAMTAYVLVVDLSSTKPQVLRRFEQHRMRDAFLSRRVLRGRSKGASAGDVEMTELDEESTTMDVDANPDAGAANSTKDDASVADSDSESEDASTTTLSATPHPATVTRMAISTDGQWLATTDDRRRTHVFNLDSIQQHCVLPSFSHAIHALAFCPPSSLSAPSSSVLVLGLADNSIHAYDVESRTFPTWARDLATSVPQRFKHLHDPIVGVAFDSASPGALFWGATWLCRVHLDRGADGRGGFDKRKRRWGGKNISAKPRPVPAHATGMNSIALGPGIADGVEVENFRVVTTYRPILFVDFIGPRELVVVERPLVDVLAKLPPAFFKPKYGAT